MDYYPESLYLFIKSFKKSQGTLPDIYIKVEYFLKIAILLPNAKISFIYSCSGYST